MLPFSAEAQWVRVRPTFVAGGGFDSNPLLLGTANLPSSSASAGAWLNIDLAFGPFTRLYAHGGAYWSALPGVDLSTTTGFAEARLLRRVGRADLELRAGGSVSDVSSMGAPELSANPTEQPVIDSRAIARTGDAWSGSGALTIASTPARWGRIGLAGVGSAVLFPHRYPTGSEESESAAQIGGLAFAEIRPARGLFVSLGAKAGDQRSNRVEQKGAGAEGYAGFWFDLHPELTLRARGEARAWNFPGDGAGGRRDRGAVAQAGLTFGRATRPVRLDVSATWMRVESTRNAFEGERVSLLAVLQVQPRGWTR